jgi:Tfp pilus assembly protein PilZ
MSSAPHGRGNLRRYPRSPVELAVVVADANNSVDAVIEFDTADLSVGGAFVRSDLLFEIGEELGFTFVLPTGESVRAHGRVVRVARDTGDEAVPGMGIAFTDLSDRDRDAIVALVTRGSHG